MKQVYSCICSMCMRIPTHMQRLRHCVGTGGGRKSRPCYPPLALLLLIELRVPLEQVLDLAAHEYAGDEQVALQDGARQR